MIYHVYSNSMEVEKLFDEEETSFNLTIKDGTSEADFFKNFNKADFLKEIGEYFCFRHLVFFSNFNNNPDVKFSATVYKTDQINEYIVAVPTAIILGLPNIAPKEELKEFKALFAPLIEKAKENPTHRISISTHRGFGESGVEISSSNKEEESQLNQQFQDTIKLSPVLTKWQENQIIAIKNTAKHCDNLWSASEICNLLSDKEQREYYEKIPVPSTKSFYKAKRKNRF